MANDVKARVITYTLGPATAKSDSFFIDNKWRKVSYGICKEKTDNEYEKTKSSQDKWDAPNSQG